MKKVVTLAVSAAFLLSVPLSASAARNGYQTVALSSTVFEVIPRTRRDVDGYWCAAADFARRTLGAGWQQRIYVVRGYGPSEATGRRTSVKFSIAPPEGGVAQQSSSISSGFNPGESMSVQGANGRCNVRPFFN
ncbi:hypothetical protein [Ruegeria sp. Ofav3-42]|uniref:hypothetical protein n=1 Tax=Ruegeria sp. Ofav3-42 TaxID=2917759 RepID=UPI001EF4372F|nr:hypothetical protein [Ruegeria sp. Ofav3-42]MCG7519751.1 hypothetical protein [Ruegeria sp. Ofav3-42]